MATLTRTLTYAELVIEITAGTLHKGEKITISDFQTKHYFTDYKTSIDVVNTGEIEPLIVEVLNNNTIANIAYSTIYPNDIIHYDWNPNNWIYDISCSLDSVEIIPGWKGIITYRRDIKKQISTGYDFRNVKFRRWKLNPDLWNSVDTYSAKSFVIDVDEYLYISIIDNNTNNLTSDSQCWIKLLDLSNPYLSFKSTIWNGIPCSGDYNDYYTFQPDFLEYMFNINIGIISGDSDSNINFNTRLNNIIIFGFATFFTFKQECYLMTFNGDDSLGANNDFTNCSEIIFGNSISSNIIKGGNNNIISYGFVGNDVSYGFNNNIIGEQFNFNNIGMSFSYNIVNSAFTMNTVLCEVDTINFGLATHVYGVYSCLLQNKVGKIPMLTYINEADAQIVISATA